jgi:hypothetical protein
MTEKHDRERHAQADHLLDRVLAHYAGEPLAGLENRTPKPPTCAAGSSGTKIF